MIKNLLISIGALMGLIVALLMGLWPLWVAIAALKYVFG